MRVNASVTIMVVRSASVFHAQNSAYLYCGFSAFLKRGNIAAIALACFRNVKPWLQIFLVN